LPQLEGISKLLALIKRVNAFEIMFRLGLLNRFKCLEGELATLQTEIAATYQMATYHKLCDLTAFLCGVDKEIQDEWCRLASEKVPTQHFLCVTLLLACNPSVGSSVQLSLHAWCR
jgi:hypothetical protein